jgi:hypothetical protein
VNEYSASTGQPLTLADLREFLTRCEQLGIPDHTAPRATIKFGGTIKKLTVRPEKATA